MKDTPALLRLWAKASGTRLAPGPKGWICGRVGGTGKGSPGGACTKGGTDFAFIESGPYSIAQIKVVASLHVAPPFVDLLTVTAFVRSRPLNAIAIWYAAPFGENVTHGSEARSKSPPFATVPPEQNVNLAKVVVPGGTSVGRVPGRQAARAAVAATGSLLPDP